MAASPFGPWRPRPAVDPDLPQLPPQRQPWVTGTADDEFVPIYLGLQARGVGRLDADAMDLTSVAAVLGIGEDPTATDDPHVSAQAINAERERRATVAMDRARAEGREITWAQAEAESGPVSWDDLPPGR